MFRRMANARRDALGKARLEVVPPILGDRHETIASFALWPWVALCNNRNLPIERLAQLAHVSVAELRDQAGRFSQVVANRVAELAFQHAGSAASMEAALTVERGHFALIELVARTSPNVSEALKLVCQYFPLIQDDLILQYETRPAQARCLKLVAPQQYVVHHGYIELTFASLLLAIRRETERPDIEPLEVWFAHRAPVDRRPFEALFGPHVRFDMPEHHLVLDRKAAALPLARKNSDVHEAAVRAAADLLRG
ncbi:MAG TPA: AraC family transcriptional regulator ligand-binding domain-containing protein [Polyangiales bacterium]|nr:AraC family transcriptional regulator ligand-binding domain-containing protein [Polyangiales bacterium]